MCGTSFHFLLACILLMGQSNGRACRWVKNQQMPRNHSQAKRWTRTTFDIGKKQSKRYMKLVGAYPTRLAAKACPVVETRDPPAV
jgi:hypothetical protein